MRWTDLDSMSRIWLRETANPKIACKAAYILILSSICAKARNDAKGQKDPKEGSIPSIRSTPSR
jgi:hypothetical protein